MDEEGKKGKLQDEVENLDDWQNPGVRKMMFVGLMAH